MFNMNHPKISYRSDTTDSLYVMRQGLDFFTIEVIKGDQSIHETPQIPYVFPWRKTIDLFFDMVDCHINTGNWNVGPKPHVTRHYAPYIVVMSFVNGDVKYAGPFPTSVRAEGYGLRAQTEYRPAKMARFHVANLIVPHAIVLNMGERTA